MVPDSLSRSNGEIVVVTAIVVCLAIWAIDGAWVYTGTRLTRFAADRRR